MISMNKIKMNPWIPISSLNEFKINHWYEFYRKNVNPLLIDKIEICKRFYSKKSRMDININELMKLGLFIDHRYNSNLKLGASKLGGRPDLLN